MAVLLKKVERPRELKWYQAGAMLYGDWGTSKAYVLGIAFALAGHASWLLLGIMSVLTALVGICYMIICREHPDGGGVYSSVKDRSQTLAVIGALLLVADYVVTASISAFEAFHYFNAPDPAAWAIFAILMIGVINWVGPTKGGTIAVGFGILASVAAGVLFLATLPHLPRVELTPPRGGLFENWSHFVGIVLALSGVEAVANMTGIMVKPVERTSRRAILPVLLEVAIVTFLLGIAMNAVPGLEGHKEDMLRALGAHYVGEWYGFVISVIFGLLLLSAANTALTGLVSVQFSMAKDHELPSVFTRLNRYGMPTLPLIVATVIPVLVLLAERDLVGLAALYAIGVVGAITLNIGATATDVKLRLRPWERALLAGCGAVLFLIELTIAFQKQKALAFALAVVGSGLLLRQVGRAVVPAPLPEVLANINVLTVSEAKEIAPLYRSSSLVAVRGQNPYLLEEAALRAKAKSEHAVYVIYVEESPGIAEFPTEIEPSRESLEIFNGAMKEMEARGVTAVPIWRVGDNPGQLIADAARELGVGTVMIGTTRRSALVRMLRGDVLLYLSQNLPKECHLVISG
jgi:amino acid transporter